MGLELVWATIGMTITTLSATVAIGARLKEAKFINIFSVEQMTYWTSLTLPSTKTTLRSAYL
jgi:hypothetical protein